MFNIFSTLKFIFINKKKYNKIKSDKIVLVELFNFRASIISNGIFANELAKIHNAKLIGYESNFLSFKSKIKNFFIRYNPLSHYYLYASYGLQSYVIPSSKVSDKKFQIILKSLKKNIRSKKDVLNIKIDSIKIGDLIYDGFLRENKLSTIDIKSIEFENYLKKSIRLFLYWTNYFNNNKVVAIIVSHSVYLTAVILRIACKKNIKVYNTGFSSAYSLTKRKPLKFAYFNEYPKNFKTLNYETRKNLINIAKKNIKMRLSGKEDLLYKESQAIREKVYTNFKVKQIKKSRNILIAAHDFTDAPHVHGKMIFNDFFDWISYLGKKSLEIKNFNWLIKLHPAEYDENLKYVKYFLNKYPSLKLLQKNISHNKIINKGIKCVLTTYGSIAHEYPLFGIPVINAGENPHSGYNFSINPKNFNQYDNLINNLSKLKKPKDVNRVYEYYAMYNLVDYNLFEELEFSQKKLNTNYIFKHFLSKYNIKSLEIIEKKYFNFIKSNKRRLIKFLH